MLYDRIKMLIDRGIKDGLLVDNVAYEISIAYNGDDARIGIGYPQVGFYDNYMELIGRADVPDFMVLSVSAGKGYAEDLEDFILRDVISKALITDKLNAETVKYVELLPVFGNSEFSQNIDISVLTDADEVKIGVTNLILSGRVLMDKYAVDRHLSKALKEFKSGAVNIVKLLKEVSVSAPYSVFLMHVGHNEDTGIDSLSIKSYSYSDEDVCRVKEVSCGLDPIKGVYLLSAGSLGVMCGFNQEVYLSDLRGDCLDIAKGILGKLSGICRYDFLIMGLDTGANAGINRAFSKALNYVRNAVVLDNTRDIKWEVDKCGKIITS